MVFYIKAFTVLLILVNYPSLSIASDQVNASNKRVESIRKKYAAEFDLIEKAFKEGNSEKAIQLIDSFEKISIHAEPNNNFSKFDESLARDDILQAKKIGYELIQSKETSYTQKAYIYQFLGDYFFSKGDFDSALIEYKKILEFPVKKNSEIPE